MATISSFLLQLKVAYKLCWFLLLFFKYCNKFIFQLCFRCSLGVLLKLNLVFIHLHSPTIIIFTLYFFLILLQTSFHVCKYFEQIVL